VTATLKTTLEVAAKSVVDTASATTKRPDKINDLDGSAGVNLFLYQVTPNPNWRNTDLPTRQSTGSLIQRPQAAFDIHYVFTFFGNERQQVPERLLGSVVSTLHSRPLLTREAIKETIRTAIENEGPDHYLAQSDLADQVELVRFSPMLLSFEDLSKLWSIFFQTPYRLSITYQGSVVLVESKDTPRPAQPVRMRNLYVESLRRPVIRSLEADSGADEPVLPGDTLVIRGENLRGDETRVLIGGTEITPAPANVSNREIRVPLAAPPLEGDAWQAGVKAVRISHPFMMGTPPQAHRGMESDVAAFILRPAVLSALLQNPTTDADGRVSAEVSVTVSPPVGKAQDVVLLLNERDPPSERSPWAYRFDAPSRDVEDAAATSDTVVVPIEGVRPATYLVRVQIDGAESLLSVHYETGRFSAPAVAIP
jgi:hypothetical protein